MTTIVGGGSSENSNGVGKQLFGIDDQSGDGVKVEKNMANLVSGGDVQGKIFIGVYD